VTDRLIRITTALAVVAVAVVAAIISYQHAYELVRSHGESGVTARLMPFTVDGLIWSASMAVLARRQSPEPARATAGRVEPWRGHRCHGWRPTWRMASGTARLVPWSANGPPWRWSAAWVRRDGRG